jgi:hypothetical protein
VVVHIPLLGAYSIVAINALLYYNVLNIQTGKWKVTMMAIFHIDLFVSRNICIRGGCSYGIKGFYTWNG